MKDQESLTNWHALFHAKAQEIYPSADPAHDVLHITRVVRTALALARKEGADENIVLPAAYFHDFVNVPKGDPRRAQASTLSAQAAGDYLLSIGYPAHYIDAIKHAIAAHSFSAGIPPQTIEAKVVQDADRLDALGAIGIARWASTNALLKTPYYCAEDLWAERRAPDDKSFALDHFAVKLLRLAETMQTESARIEARRRTAFMQTYLTEFGTEITS